MWPCKHNDQIYREHVHYVENAPYEVREDGARPRLSPDGDVVLESVLEIGERYKEWPYANIMLRRVKSSLGGRERTLPR